LAKRKPARKRIESPFRKNLKRILEERGIAQKAAAAIAEVTPATMSDWVSGGSVPHDHQKIQKLCRALKCDFEWLLTGSQSRTDINDISMTELFDSEPDPTFSGIFEISAKRLRRKTKE
jgi:transcriptional regulator with XRE-family HTH domain